MLEAVKNTRPSMKKTLFIAGFALMVAIFIAVLLASKPASAHTGNY